MYLCQCLRSEVMAGWFSTSGSSLYVKLTFLWILNVATAWVNTSLLDFGFLGRDWRAANWFVAPDVAANSSLCISLIVFFLICIRCVWETYLCNLTCRVLSWPHRQANLKHLKTWVQVMLWSKFLFWYLPLVRAVRKQMFISKPCILLFAPLCFL